MRSKLFLTATALGLLTLGLGIASCGPSKAVLAIRSAPSVSAVSGLKDKLIWLQGNAQSGGEYLLEIDADELELKCGFLSSCGDLSYKKQSGITIILRGLGANRFIHSGFSVKSGVTLVLDDNITLNGKTEAGALVSVYSGGALVMNKGAAITGATNSYNTPGEAHVRGAGVYVSDGGSFTMKGGSISGNTISPRILTEREVMAAIEGAKIGSKLGNSITAGVSNKLGVPSAAVDPEAVAKKYAVNVVSAHGAGLYVSGGATFVKTGGTIAGYSDDVTVGNAIINAEDGSAINGRGHAAFFAGASPVAIDGDIGPEVQLNFSGGHLTQSTAPPEGDGGSGAQPAGVGDDGEGWFASDSSDGTIGVGSAVTSANDTRTVNTAATAPAGVLSDPRDGASYRTVTIGAQTWMAQNLNHRSEGSKCYKDADAACERFGRLYSWSEAKGACPIGWHLPDSAEWNALTQAAGGKESAGKRLKSRGGRAPNDTGTDDFGFSALPGGFHFACGECRADNTGFQKAGLCGSWWSATAAGGVYPDGSPFTGGNFRYILAEESALGEDSEEHWKAYLNSVRCVKDY